jgi:hypothetical protein
MLVLRMHCVGFGSGPERTQLIIKVVSISFSTSWSMSVLCFMDPIKFMMNVFALWLSISFFFFYLTSLASFFFTHKQGHTLYTCKTYPCTVQSLQFDSSLLFENTTLKSTAGHGRGWIG